MEKLKYMLINDDSREAVYVVTYLHETLKEYRISDFGMSMRTGYVNMASYESDMKKNHGAESTRHNNMRVTCYREEKQAKLALDYLESRVVMGILRGEL